MPHNVNIEVFLLAKTEVNKEEINKYLQHLKADKFNPNFENKTSAELLVELGGRRCYMSFQPGLNPNVTKIREDVVQYIDNILSSGHGSVLEHVNFTFAIEGVSRVFTGEMNRHRAGFAISEGSMRFIRYEDIGWWMPTSMIPRENDPEEVVEMKLKTQKIFHKAFLEMEENQKLLNEIWNLDEGSKNFHYKKLATSMFRRIIGMGVATGGIWTGNIRALRHVLTMRTTKYAEEEIYYVFNKIMGLMKESEPSFFGDFVQDEFGYWKPKYFKV